MTGPEVSLAARTAAAEPAKATSTQLVSPLPELKLLLRRRAPARSTVDIKLTLLGPPSAWRV